MTTTRARLLEIAAAEVAANAHPPTADQKAVIQSQLAPSVAQATSKTQDAAGKPAA